MPAINFHNRADSRANWPESPPAGNPRGLQIDRDRHKSGSLLGDLSPTQTKRIAKRGFDSTPAQPVEQRGCARMGVGYVRQRQPERRGCTSDLTKNETELRE
jgi:hypothetical protein